MSVQEYLTAIVHRRRIPMEPLDFEPDWGDKPRRHKVYAGAPRFPLRSDSAAREAASLEDALRTDAGDERFTLGLLGDMLRDSYGLLGRRLGVQSNHDLDTLSHYRTSVLWRGTASGGGLYPAEIYWVTGGSGPMLPGVYYYSTSHHEMQRLLAGDAVGQVRAALDDPQAAETDQFLLVSIKFWKNAFKYNSFAYHAVTMDVGTLLGTWNMWSKAHGLALRPALAFDEPALNELLGLQTHVESVFAVVPLPWSDQAPRSAASGFATSSVRLVEQERSRKVIRFQQVENVHLATVEAGSAPRPKPQELAVGAASIPDRGRTAGVTLPEPAPLAMSVPDALRARRSSFGRFSSHRPVPLDSLTAVLNAASVGGQFPSNIKLPDGTPALTRLCVFANHVENLPQGSYDYDPETRRLHAISSGAYGRFLQTNYFLKNYNLEQAAAVLVVMARPEAVMSAVGPRGYRYVNAEVGAVAQVAYTACAALGVGCGAALGFDNVSYAEELGTAGTGEWPLLILMIGNERRDGANFDCRIG